MITNIQISSIPTRKAQYVDLLDAYRFCTILSNGGVRVNKSFYLRKHVGFCTILKSLENRQIGNWR